VKAKTHAAQKEIFFAFPAAVWQLREIMPRAAWIVESLHRIWRVFSSFLQPQHRWPVKEI
jgi:hypothetical protein